MQVKKDTKNVTSFRKALMVPFIICILTFFTNIKNSYEWFELKYLDLLFTFYPQICELTGYEVPIDTNNSPTVIITKDQSFQSKFGRSPNRKDFANLLEKLNKQGVKTAALDYIYVDARNEEEDKALIEQLDRFPYPILAYNFVGRGQQNFGLVDVLDKKANRVSGLVSLYRPISEKAITRGLINIPSDLDSIIRYAPLAFHQDESERFLPSLGFSTWIVSLLAEEESNLNKIDFSKPNLTEIFGAMKSAAPYEFHTLGHIGLDRAAIDLENNFLYKFIIKRYPRLKVNNLSTLREMYSKFPSSKTWMKLPEKPLPIIGNYDTPCIRLPYVKLAPPLRGDDIETKSMTLLMNTKEEENSTHLFSKNELVILPDEPFQKINPEIPFQAAGQNSFSGEIITLSGKPVIDAKIWAIMPQTGYWEKAQTNEKGQYRLENLPNGDFVLIVFRESLNGCDKAMLSAKTDQKDKKLPLLMFADNTNILEIPTEIIPNTAETELWIHGEIIPMIYSDKEGNTLTKKIPEGYSIISLNDNEDAEEIFTLDENGRLYLNEQPSSKAVAAVLPDDDNWKLNFYRKVSLSKTKDVIINDLPPSLDSVINLTSKSGRRNQQNNQELVIKPGSPILLSNLPRPFLEYKTNINLRVDFSNSTNKDEKVILLSEAGKEFEIKQGTSLDIPTDKYIALTQSGNLKGRHKEETIKKKTVFLGTALSTDQDFIISPINFLDINFNRMAGVHVHANLFSALTLGRFFYAPPFHMDRAPDAWPYYQFLLILPLLIVLNIKLKNARTNKSTLIILLIVLVICLTSILLFPRRIIIPVFYPSLLIISFGISRGFVEWINSRRLATETQNAFSRFISADIVSQIVNNPDAIKPGGEKKELTVMFTDIAGFTSISEKLDADALTELMNSYLDEMTKILFKNGGTLDKYIGDAIMGFWNHPTSQEDHATRAVTCAIEMQKKLKEMRENWIAQGLPKVEMRAGINTGTCMVGFIGSKIQMNFTCLGDNVNLASRLEGANKAYGTFIMVSEPVRKKLNPYLFSTRFLDFLAVKGKNEPVLVYEVRGWANEESPMWLDIAGKIYQEGIDKYLAREWDDAIIKFSEVLSLFPDDAPSKVYIERCNHFKRYPPEENWDGRFVLKTK